MGRTAWTVAGGIVGAFFGYPQLGMVIGGAIGSVVDPERITGPRIGETSAQTSMEGAARPIVFGAAPVFGNVIASGVLVHQEVETEGDKGGPVTSEDHVYRTYAIRICEGPIGGILRVWEDEKLVYDVRAGSLMLEESSRWIYGCNLYLGDEEQLPDVFLQILVNIDQPAYRGTAYMVFVGRDLTDRRGSIPQYRFEVARTVTPAVGAVTIGPVTSPPPCMSMDESGAPVLLTETTDGSTPTEIGEEGSYTLTTFDENFEPDSFDTFSNAADSLGDKRLYPIAFGPNELMLSADGNFGYCKLIAGGSAYAYYKPTLIAPPSWWFGEGQYIPEYGGLAWFSDTHLYLGVWKTNNTEWNSIFKFPLTSNAGVADAADSGAILPSATLSNAASTGFKFWMHRSRGGNIRTIDTDGIFKTYDEDLALQSTDALPAAVAALFPNSDAINGFAVDETLGMLVIAGPSDGGTNLTVYRLSDGTVLQGVNLDGATGVTTRIIFSGDNLYVQRNHHTYKIELGTVDAVPMLLADVVAEIHDRCDFPQGKFDVTELTDEVAGLVLAGDYTGADAINTLRAPYFFDKYEADGEIRYPKRGGAVVGTLTIDDLVEEPDESERKQAIEYPKKLHLAYQHAASGYAPVKATYARSSPDARVVGEVSSQVPVVFNEDEAAQIVHKMFKVTYAEAEGDVTIAVPQSFLWITPTDCIGLSLRGTLKRLRVEKADHADGILKWTLKHDRQSAYTSNLTGVPVAPPTLPPSTITGSTVLAVMDIGSRVDSEDDLHLLYAVTGGKEAWYGALVQRSLDGGATYMDAASINRASVMGSLIDAIPVASEFYTDRTNVVRLQLYRDTQTIESITEAQFLSEQGAFALEKADGSFEVMQYMTAADEGDGVYALSILHRGLLNSEPSAHNAGAKFVMLDRATHADAQSAWIGQVLTHRAPSFEQAAESASEQSATYVGRSQIEWPVAYLTLSRDGSDIVSASWTPRHRFGSDDAPVASINFQGYRVTITGSSVVTFDTATAGFSYDASALGGSVTVSVSALNRITGAGPATSGTI